MTHIYHPNVNTVVPWQANYSFPSQATQIHKQVVKLQPQSTSAVSLGGGSMTIINFPSDGYLNQMNSVLRFDVAFTYNSATPTIASLSVTASSTGTVFTITNNNNNSLTNDKTTANFYKGYYFYLPVDDNSPAAIQNDFQRGMWFVCTAQTTGGALTLKRVGKHMPHQVALADGAHTFKVFPGIKFQKAGAHELIKRVRWMYGGMPLEDIEGYGRLARILTEVAVGEGYRRSAGAIMDGMSTGFFDDSEDFVLGSSGEVPEYVLSAAGLTVTRTYAIQLFTGIATLKKLLPLKWMAAQFSLVLEWNSVADAIISLPTTSSTGVTVDNINYIAELMEFDSVYDAAFVSGMQTMGVPLKFTSWRRYHTNITGSNEFIQIHERARSIKSALAVICDKDPVLYRDSNLFYYDVGTTASTDGVSAEATPSTAKVRSFQWRVGGKYYPAQPVDCSKGAPEAYLELAKTINTLGDYSFENNISLYDWTSTYGHAGRGHKFIISAEFENSDVFPNTISGINGENQSDIMLNIQLESSAGDITTRAVTIFVAFDNLMIIRDGNVVDLVK